MSFAISHTCVAHEEHLTAIAKRGFRAACCVGLAERRAWAVSTETMNRRAMLPLIVLLVLTLGVNAFARDASKKPCTKSEAIQAEKEVDSLVDWDHVYRSYRAFSQCDDGAIGEGYSDVIGKLLANDWRNVHRLVTLTKADKGFQGFVVKHIDDTLPGDTLRRISNNARSFCPAGAQRLCNLIADAASGKPRTGPR